jgi:hypothetical protein
MTDGDVLRAIRNRMIGFEHEMTGQGCSAFMIVSAFHTFTAEFAYDHLGGPAPVSAVRSSPTATSAPRTGPKPSVPAR